MTNTVASLPASGANAAADYHQYSVASRLEISQILRAIMRQAALITASVGGDEFFLTTLVRVDDETGTLMLESAKSSKHVARVLEKQRLLCNTTLDKIKIQFVCTDLEVAVCDGQDAFRAALPAELLRLQRREYFRVATPIVSPVKCTFSIPKNGGGTAAVDLSLIDISCGGIAALTPQEVFTPELGVCYDCTLHLPGGAPLRTQVQARNAFMMNLANGKVAQRSGFAFVDLRESMLATIQRFIMVLERQRKDRAR